MPWCASLLSTYSQERHTIAEGLIEFDRTWSTMIGSKAADPDNPDAGGVSAEDVERQFTAGGRFTAGLSTQYGPSLLTGSDEHQQLAPGFEVGTRFHSAPVIQVSDAKPVQLGHVHRADGRWRLYAFADVGGLAEGSRLDGLVQDIAQVLPLDAAAQLAEFFAGFMLEQG